MKLKAALLAAGLLVGASAQANIIYGTGSLSPSDPLDDWYFSVTDSSHVLVVMSSGAHSSSVDLFFDGGSLIASAEDSGLFDTANIFEYLGEDDYLLRVTSSDFGGSPGLSSLRFLGLGNDAVDYLLTVTALRGHVEWTEQISVAEPSTLALAGLGLIGLGVLRHRRTR